MTHKRFTKLLTFRSDDRTRTAHFEGTVRVSSARSYRSGQASGWAGSGGPRTGTCRGGSRGWSRLRCSGRCSRCGAGSASVRFGSMPAPQIPLATPPPQPPLGPPCPPAPLVVLAVAAGEVRGAHTEASQHAGAPVPAAARWRRTCGVTESPAGLRPERSGPPPGGRGASSPLGVCAHQTLLVSSGLKNKLPRAPAGRSRPGAPREPGSRPHCLSHVKVSCGSCAAGAQPPWADHPRPGAAAQPVPVPWPGDAALCGLGARTFKDKRLPGKPFHL